MKKEELIEQLGNLKQENQTRVMKDQVIRNEFAKAFSWYKPRGTYDHEQEVLLPSWEQIFVEVGKLLNVRDFRDLEGNVSELEYKLEDLTNKIKSDIHPNL